MPVLLDNHPPVPLRSFRFARFLSTGGEQAATWGVAVVIKAVEVWSEEGAVGVFGIVGGKAGEGAFSKKRQRPVKPV